MNYNIDQMASQYGLSSPYVDRLKTTSQYITNSFNKDKESIGTQYNQILNDYENERKNQNQKFVDEGKAAYVDYAKSINPYSADKSSNASIGLNGSGFSESSQIGANNTYQNRYTNTKNNFETIFADINNRVGKAKENRSIEEAKIAKEEQNQLLQNFWRINETYQTDKAREMEQRRWEQEMALSRSKANQNTYSELPLDQPSEPVNNNVINGDERLYDYINSFAKKWSKNKNSGFKKTERDAMVKVVNDAKSKNRLSEEQINNLLTKLGVK